MIRIEATYPATDGSAPERIEITWEDSPPTTGDLAVLVEVLAKAATRYEIRADQPMDIWVTTENVNRARTEPTRED